MATNDKSSIAIQSTDASGKKYTKTVTDINPKAASAQLKTLAQMINSLSTNSYQVTVRVDKKTVDDATGKTIPTLTLSKTSATVAEIVGVGVAITYNGDAVPYVVPDNYDARVFPLIVAVDGSYSLGANAFGEPDTSKLPVAITVRADETDNFAAAEATFTITED